MMVYIKQNNMSYFKIELKIKFKPNIIKQWYLFNIL